MITPPPSLDPVDKLIIDNLQANFPLNSRPYKVLGDKLGLTENEVWSRVKNLKETGYIRRLGANFNSKALGYSSVLCAAKVPQNKMTVFIEAVNRHPGVTHNYLRKGDLNVWFTYIGQSLDDVDKTIKDIKAESGIDNVYMLPAEKVFKIDVRFKLSEKNNTAQEQE